jgi:hypothetical protein
MQRRTVVHAIAGHRHHVAAGLQRLGDRQFLLGGNAASDHAVAVHQRAEHGLVLRQLVAGHQQVCPQADLAGDGARGPRVIAGDHRDAQPGGVTLGERVAHLGAWRIEQADQPEQLEVRLCSLSGLGQLARW